MHTTLSSFRRRRPEGSALGGPESTISEHKLDPGLRRDDGSCETPLRSLNPFDVSRFDTLDSLNCSRLQTNQRRCYPQDAAVGAA